MIPLGSEKRSLQFKFEAFNVFNHAEFNGQSSSYTFNASGVNTVTSIGQYNSDRGPRILSLEARVEF